MNLSLAQDRGWLVGHGRSLQVQYRLHGRGVVLIEPSSSLAGQKPIWVGEKSNLGLQKGEGGGTQLHQLFSSLELCFSARSRCDHPL